MDHKRIGALLAAAALTLTACGAQPEPPEETTAGGVAVEVETVVRDTMAAENRVSGSVASDDEATVMVAASAKCTAVYAEAGDAVSQGDILCTLDLGSTLASRDAARISYDAAVQSYQDQKVVLDEQVNLCAKTVSDLEALLAIGAASQLELDQARLQLQTAQATRNATLSQLEAGVESARSGLEQLETALEDVDGAGNVVAPMSGTLVTMNAVENAFVSNTMPVAVIQGADAMKITVSVAETLVAKIAAGDEAEVYVSAVDQRFTAVVRSVEQAAGQQTRLYTVTLEGPPEAAGLRSGMSAEGTFRTDVVPDTVVVPSQAVLTSGGVNYVYIVENDTARYVEVTTGLAGDGVTEIVSGLDGGEALVTVGQSYLADGDAGRIVGGEA